MPPILSEDTKKREMGKLPAFFERLVWGQDNFWWYCKDMQIKVAETWIDAKGRCPYVYQWIYLVQEPARRYGWRGASCNPDGSILGSDQRQQVWDDSDKLKNGQWEDYGELHWSNSSSQSCFILTQGPKTSIPQHQMYEFWWRCLNSNSKTSTYIHWTRNLTGIIIRSVQDYHPSSGEEVSGARWSQERSLWDKESPKKWHAKEYHGLEDPLQQRRR